MTHPYNYVHGVDVLTARHAALEIFMSAHTAYYLKSSDAEAPWTRSQLSTMHKSFADLAEAMGYRVELIEPVDTDHSTHNVQQLGLSSAVARV